MSGIKITYFKGINYLKGEVPKVTLFMKDIPFEDVRISFEEWPQHKEKFPFGQLPVLEADGKWLTQGLAQYLYTAKLAGLFPKDDLWAEAKVTEVLMLTEDMLGQLVNALYNKDESLREPLRKEACTTVFPLFAGRFEKVLGDNEFFVGNELTVADIAVWSLMNRFKSGQVDHIPTTIFDSHEKLTALYKRVDNLPKIQEWRAKHQDIYNF